MGHRSADAAHDSVSVEDHQRLLQDLAALRDQFEAADEVLTAQGVARPRIPTQC